MDYFKRLLIDKTNGKCISSNKIDFKYEIKSSTKDMFTFQMQQIRNYWRYICIKTNHAQTKRNNELSLEIEVNMFGHTYRSFELLYFLL